MKRDGLLILLDEFDVMQDKAGLGSLIKSLTTAEVKFGVCGIGRDLSDLVEDHASVERLLEQGVLAVRPMPLSESEQIISRAEELFVGTVGFERGIPRILADTELSESLINAFSGAIRLGEMRRAVQELRVHLSNDVADESVYQSWCQKHSWAFGNAYVMTDRVREISPGDHLDLLLPTVISGYRDIVELERPDAPVLLFDSAHRSFYFSADVSKAIGQCHRYLDVLHEVAANGLRDHPDIVAYHPRAMIVIGRSAGWSEEKLRALHGLNSRLTGVSVMTYDHLIAQGERLVELLSVKPPDVSEPGLETLDDDFF